MAQYTFEHRHVAMNENLQLSMESFIYKVNFFAFSGTTDIVHGYETLRLGMH